jgi:hypothetical protein
LTVRHLIKPRKLGDPQVSFSSSFRFVEIPSTDTLSRRSTYSSIYLGIELPQIKGIRFPYPPSRLFSLHFLDRSILSPLYHLYRLYLPPTLSFPFLFLDSSSSLQSTAVLLFLSLSFRSRSTVFFVIPPLSVQLCVINVVNNTSTALFQL